MSHMSLDITELKMTNVLKYNPKVASKTDELKVMKLMLFYLLFIPCLVYLTGDKDFNAWVDEPTYQNYFYLATYNNYIEIFKNGVDPLFVSFMRPFTSIYNGFNVFLLVCAFITLTIKITALKNSTDNFFILMLLYGSYLLFLHDYTQIRIALAMAFVAFGIYCNKSRTSMSIFFCIGALVHLTTILIIITFLIYRRFGYKKFFWVVLFSFFLPLIVFSGVIHNARLETYIELAKYKEQYFEANFFASQPILQIIGIMYIYVNSKLRKYICTYEYCFSMLGVVLFYSFSSVPVLSFRLFEMTMFFYIILLSRLFFISNFIKIICLLYLLVGVKNLFYGASAIFNLTS
ncbi:hypothetical protein GCM10023078_24760 [Gibbsiella greigii]